MEQITPGIFVMATCFVLALSLKEPAIIIIGAGPAGIAAATRLLENNFNNIKILEAEPRIGGRINSVEFGDAYVDLGAQWCHGQKDNIVYQLVKDLNVLKHTTFSSQTFHSSRKLIDDKFAEELFSIIESIYSADGNRDESDYTTLGDYNRTIYEKYGHNREKLQLALSALDYFQHVVLSYEGSFSWFDPAAKNDYRDCDGDLHLNWNGLGYKTILEVLMRKYPDPKQQLPIDDKTLLNKEVVTIRWNKNAQKDGVTVSCSDRSVYTADNIIFTPSIGVLKEKGSDMFIPRLPNSKNEAIKNIGFGAVMKVVMHFSKNWWGSSNGFNFVWSEEDKRSVLWEFPEGPHWKNDLAMPIKNSQDRPIIQFAGEATHPYYYSTVHGAIETGYREADVLINMYL
ncbi:hypothetical protein NQ314_003813 [Rhamnusium bicolor]|uniref:Amine oxidase domain-containing protein n=1 Tax=Rhamnusium bicolor TaxID=1586634 RepID=A0AAV8ZN78_9CUCU|nr:hypothetical protein NQ314_003813 [Rhamnusium bicolor]